LSSHARRGRRGSPASWRKKARLVLEPLEPRALLTSYYAGSVSALIADINAANTNGGANTITLTAATTAPYVLTAVINSIYGGNGLPVIAANDNLTIVGGGDTIERSTASGTADFGLFFVNEGASLALQSLTLQGGHAHQGGAISNDGALTLNGVVVEDNIADTDGGGIYSSAGSVTLEGGSIIQDNIADGAFGYGSHYYFDIPAYGGGIYAGFCTVTVTNATLNNNKAGFPYATGYGGGMYALGARVTMTNATVAKNTSTYGGGLSLGNNSGASLINCIMRGNSARQGGGVYEINSTLTLANDTVESNSAGQQGGGLYLGSAATLTSDTVEANSALTGGGIDVNGTYALVTLTNCALDNNATKFSLGGGRGGALSIDEGRVTLVNDKVESNSALVRGLGGGIYISSISILDLDSSTLANTINNTDKSGLNGATANIDGKYTLIS
jgi:hypothetical protein